MDMNFLDDVNVVEFGRVLSAPYASKLLADMGANVIKIEIGTGDPYRHLPPFVQGKSIWYENFNNGKRAINIDSLSNWANYDEVMDAIKGADIFIENFRPGTLRKVGLDYTSMKKINERIIYTSISAFGQNSSFKDRAGYDIIVQALSGYLLDYTDGKAMHPHTYLSDYASGLLAAFSSITALHKRKSVHIDVSMFDVLVNWSSILNLVLLYDPEFASRIFKMDPVAFPYGIFDTLEGNKIVIAAVGESMAQRFYDAFEKEFKGGNIEFSSFLDPKEMVALYKSVSSIIATLPLNEISGRLDAKKVPWEVVSRGDDLVKLPPVRERELFKDVNIDGRMIKLSRIPILAKDE